MPAAPLFDCVLMVFSACCRLYVLHRVTVGVFYALLAWLVWSVVTSLSGVLPAVSKLPLGRWMQYSLGLNALSSPV